MLALEIDGLVTRDDGLPIATEWCMRRQRKIHRSGEEGRRKKRGESRLHHDRYSEVRWAGLTRPGGYASSVTFRQPECDDPLINRW